MPRHDPAKPLIVRNPDAPVRKSNAYTLVDLERVGREVPVVVRHPNGQMIVLVLEAHRGSLTAYAPLPSAVRAIEDSDDVALSWWMPA